MRAGEIDAAMTPLTSRAIFPGPTTGQARRALQWGQQRKAEAGRHGRLGGLKIKADETPARCQHLIFGAAAPHDIAPNKMRDRTAMGDSSKGGVDFLVGLAPHVQEPGANPQIGRGIEESGCAPVVLVARRGWRTRAPVQIGLNAQEAGPEARFTARTAAALHEHQSRQQERIDRRLGRGGLNQIAQRLTIWPSGGCTFLGRIRGRRLLGWLRDRTARAQVLDTLAKSPRIDGGRVDRLRGPASEVTKLVRWRWRNGWPAGRPRPSGVGRWRGGDDQTDHQRQKCDPSRQASSYLTFLATDESVKTSSMLAGNA